MTEEDNVQITMPIELVEQLIKPWYLIKQWNAEKIREACRQALIKHKNG